MYTSNYTKPFVVPSVCHSSLKLLGTRPDKNGGLISGANHCFQSILGLNTMYSRPRIDEQGNIYICGGFTQGNTFMGHTFENRASSIGMAVYILSISPVATRISLPNTNAVMGFRI